MMRLTYVMSATLLAGNLLGCSDPAGDEIQVDASSGDASGSDAPELEMCTPEASWTVETIDMPVSNHSIGGASTAVAVDRSGGVHVSYVAFDQGGTGDFTTLKYGYKPLGGAWILEDIDATDAAQEETSIAIDAAGVPHVAYLSRSPSNDLDLIHAYRTGASTWVTEIADADGRVGRLPHLAIDAAQTLHVGYYDQQNFTLKYARRLAQGAWQAETADPTPGVGARAWVVPGASGVDIAYADGSRGGLLFVSGGFGAWGSPVHIDDTPEGNVLDTAMVRDSTGQLHIVYGAVSALDPEAKYDLRYARRSTAGAWAWENLELGGQLASFTGLVVDGDDQLHAIYSSDLDNILYYRRRTNTGTWDPAQEVDGDGTEWPHLDNGLALSPTGRLHAVYLEALNRQVRLASRCAPRP